MLVTQRFNILGVNASSSIIPFLWLSMAAEVGKSEVIRQHDMLQNDTQRNNKLMQPRGLSDKAFNGCNCSEWRWQTLRQYGNDYSCKKSFIVR